MTDWLILRCSGSSTLRLAQSLSLGGFETWTPVEFQVKRDRKTGARHERMVAVMPTYVFAKAERIADLVELSKAPITPYPDFSVFKHQDRFPLVADSELSSLRQIERQAASKGKPVVFGKGAGVNVLDGAFQGLTGQVVKKSRGKYTLVAFPGFHIPVSFHTWQLSAVELEPQQSGSIPTRAARAA